MGQNFRFSDAGRLVVCLREWEVITDAVINNFYIIMHDGHRLIGLPYYTKPLIHNMIKQLVETLDRATLSMSFGLQHRRENIGLDRLRHMYRNDRAAYYDLKILLTYEFAESEISILSNLISEFMSEYICPDTGRIGNGLVNIMGGKAEPSVPDFAKLLVRASVVLGADQVIQNLCDWKAEKPIRFRRKMWLVGTHVEESLSLAKGISIKNFRCSSDKLSAHFPFDMLDMRYQYGEINLLSGTVLSVEHEKFPKFYRPPISSRIIEDIKQANEVFRDAVKDLSPQSFCEALSLAQNHDVRVRFMWNDFGDLQEYQSGSGMAEWDTGMYPASKLLTQGHLDKAAEILSRYHASGQTCSERVPSDRGKISELDTAIDRWRRSKRSNIRLIDRLIELRIALEALYIDDGQGELRFRLALIGAWHLGKTYYERQQIFDSLHRLYKLASTVVHAGYIDGSSEDRIIKLEKELETAQDLCRQGILKKICEDRDLEWKELILGFRHNN